MHCRSGRARGTGIALAWPTRLVVGRRSTTAATSPPRWRRHSSSTTSTRGRPCRSTAVNAGLARDMSPQRRSDGPARSGAPRNCARHRLPPRGAVGDRRDGYRSCNSVDRHHQEARRSPARAGRAQRVGALGALARVATSSSRCQRPGVPRAAAMPRRRTRLVRGPGLRPAAVYRLVVRRARAAAIDMRVCTHSLRHTTVVHATARAMARDRGATEEQIARRLGHASTATTELYGHGDSDEIVPTLDDDWLPA